MSRLAFEAGWYAVLRVPALISDAELSCKLLEGYGVAVHSGDFFGFGRSGWLVVSLLCPEEEFRRGIGAITDFFGAE